MEEAICNAGTYHPDLEFLARRRILLSVGAKDWETTGDMLLDEWLGTMSHTDVVDSTNEGEPPEICDE